MVPWLARSKRPRFFVNAPVNAFGRAKEAMDALGSARPLGTLRALDRAEAVLDRAVTDRVATHLRQRVFELAEAPPHYLKFDRRFITGIDQAPDSRQRLLASLVAATRELLVRTIAEGVETAEEAAACLTAGFTYAQGFYFGRPGPVESL